MREFCDRLVVVVVVVVYSTVTIATQFSLLLNLTVNRRTDMPEESSRLVMPLLLLLVLTAIVGTVHSSPLTSKRASDLESYEHLEPAVGTTSSPPASSAAVDIEPPASTLPIAAAASEESGGPVHVDLPLQPFGELPLPPGALQPPRRIVSYDQRQDGKYNIRADLENFMIVVIPSSPASGASLLDLLTRQNQQQKSTSANNKASAQQRKKEHGPHKKYHAGSAGTKAAAAIEDLPKAPSVNSKMNLVLLQEAVSAELARRQHSLSSQQQLLQPDTFIEGRTPYRVDISSATAGAVQPISSVVSRLPYYARSAKSLRPGNVAALPSIDLGHNSVVLVGRLPLHKQRGFAWANTFVDKSDADRYDAAVLLRGSDDDDDNNDDDNVALVEATLSGGAGDNGGSDSIDRLAAGDLPKSGPSNSGTAGGWDQLTLLGDGVEQCGPDRRRDSYGVCQFVPID